MTERFHARGPAWRARLHLGWAILLCTLPGVPGVAGQEDHAERSRRTESPAALSRVGRVPVACPCCGERFEALAVGRANTLEGVDRDLFARSLGPQPIFYRVSTCPRCYYSGYLEDFGADVHLPPDIVAGLTDPLSQADAGAEGSGSWPLRLGRLEPSVEIALGTDQKDIPASVRYELAVECYRRLQRSDEALAWLCLRASWVIREENAFLPPADRVARMLDYVRRWLPGDSPVANQADREMVMCTTLAAAVAEGHFDIYQKPYAELVLAMLLRRHGENLPAARLLDRLLSEHEFPEELARAAARMRDSIQTERRWQGEAASYFRRALRIDAVAPANQAPALYLLGELHRRLGDAGRAVEFFDRALKRSDLPPDLRQWALEQRQEAQRDRRFGELGPPGGAR